MNNFDIAMKISDDLKETGREPKDYEIDIIREVVLDLFTIGIMHQSKDPAKYIVDVFREILRSQERTEKEEQ